MSIEPSDFATEAMAARVQCFSAMVSLPTQPAQTELFRVPERLVAPDPDPVPRAWAPSVPLRARIPHAVKVALRAGAVTLAAGAAAYAVAPRLSPAVAIAAGAAALAFELSRVRQALSRAIDELGADLAQIQPLIALDRMLPTRRPLPMMREYAIAPDCAVLIAQLVADERPELVLETGSGVSTLVIAYALQKLGRGRVVALEHDPAYARRTRTLIAQHGLSAYASVVDAPLEPVMVAGRPYHWYSTRALAGLGRIDLVVDDGPPRLAGTMLRYASLPLLAPRLTARSTFLLDVVAQEEREILARWSEELPMFAQEHLATKKGNVILRRRALAHVHT